MKQPKGQLLDRLISVAQEMPDDKLREVLDFTEYLQSKYSTQRGSAEMILQTLKRVGPLRFEPDELDALLADIDEMRALDIVENDRLFT